MKFYSLNNSSPEWADKDQTIDYQKNLGILINESVSVMLLVPSIFAFIWSLDKKQM